MRRRRLVLFAVPVLALAGAGCGSSPDTAEVDTGSGELVPIVARAAAETGAAPTGRFEVTTAMEAPVVGEVTIVTEGAYDQAAGRAQITTDTGSIFGGLGGEDLGELGDVLGGEWEVVVDGTTAYLRMGGVGALLGADTEWVSLPSEADAMAASPAGPVGAEELLDVLAGVAEVSEVGSEDVRGVATTHYTATVDADALVEMSAADAEAQGADPAEVDQAVAALEAAGVELGVIPVDVWVDGDGLVRRVTMAMSVAGLGSVGGDGDGATMEVTAEYFDFGAPVDIVVPDPSEVTTIDPEQLAGGDLGSLLGD